MKKNEAWVSESEKAHGKNWREWLGHLKDRPAYGLELGTWMGESAEWMLNNVFTHPESRYCCVDTFEGSEEHHLAGIDCSEIEKDCRERLAPFTQRVIITKGFSHEVLRDHQAAIFDFVYVDAAHDAMNVLRDSVLAFDLLKVGGIIMWDDYNWKVMPDEMDCPKLGVDSFIACFGKRVEIIGMGYQVCARKIC